MQGTVYSFETDSREGVVLLDDGSPVPFDTAAFDAGGLRFLRPGQRVRMRMDGDRVVLVTLYTLPDPML
jgi:cold shock CspA family protein